MSPYWIDITCHGISGSIEFFFELRMKLVALVLRHGYLRGRLLHDDLISPDENSNRYGNAVELLVGY